MTEEQTAKLRQLACFLKTSKHEEDEARKSRIKIENEIAALLPGPDKGQHTIDLGDGIRVTVERGFNYKADLAAIEVVMQNPTMPAPVKTKTTRELDITGYEWYRMNHPALFAEIAKHVTVTPKKVAVSVKGL